MASAVLLLAVVSTLVAFQGWPGTDLSDDVNSLVVEAPKRLAVDGRVQVAQNAAAAAAAVADSPVPGTAAATPPRTIPIDTSRTTTPVSVPVPGRGEGGSQFNDRDDRIDGNTSPPRPVDEPGGLLPETPLTPQVRRITDGLGDSTQGLTDDLGSKVGQINPELGQTVTDTGRILADLLRGLGRPRR